MTERRVLIALLLLAIAAALYIRVWPGTPGPKPPDTPSNPEIKERTGANPFPA